LIAGFVSLAGANYGDDADCGGGKTVGPMSVLQIHGDADGTVPYNGGQLVGTKIPSSAESIAPWATRAGCAAELTATGETIDLDTGLPGAETVVEEHAACTEGRAVERWTIKGGQHIPALDPTFPTRVVDFLMAHPKP
jgi:polyhydroxybutyrate depolymerase